MLIYLDLLFILNLWIDFLLLVTTNMIMKNNCLYKRIILSSLIGACSTFLVFIDNSTLLIISKLLICIVMQLIANGYKGLKSLIENVFYFYLTSIILSGTFYLLNGNNIGLMERYLLLFVFTPVILYINSKKINKLNTYYKDVYDITLVYKNKKYKFNGMVDTGNNLYDQYKKRPISLIYFNKIKPNYEDLILVPMETANGKSILKCIKVDKMIIDNKIINKPLVGLSQNKFKIQDINMIIHKDLIGGIK